MQEKKKYCIGKSEGNSMHKEELLEQIKGNVIVSGQGN
jgi:hypothetical protein